MSGSPRTSTAVMLRNPDPWDAVRDQFGATRIDRRLVVDPRARDLAAGILAARGEAPWPPARAGFLTLDHVCAAVANRQLGFTELSETVAPEQVLAWAADSGSSPPSRTSCGTSPASHSLRPSIEWLCRSLRQGRHRSSPTCSTAARVEDVVPARACWAGSPRLPSPARSRGSSSVSSNSTSLTSRRTSCGPCRAGRGGHAGSAGADRRSSGTPDRADSGSSRRPCW